MVLLALNEWSLRSWFLLWFCFLRQTMTLLMFYPLTKYSSPFIFLLFVVWLLPHCITVTFQCDHVNLCTVTLHHDLALWPPCCMHCDLQVTQRWRKVTRRKCHWGMKVTHEKSLNCEEKVCICFIKHSLTFYIFFITSWKKLLIAFILCILNNYLKLHVHFFF